MNDPAHNDLPRRSPDAPTSGGPERKGSSPLIWILLLVALVFLGWYVLNQRSMDATREVPDAPVIGDGIAPPAEREPAVRQDDADATPPAAARAAAPEAAPADRDARPVSQPAPEYPASAVRNREEGTVMLVVDVGADGRPTDVRVEERSRSSDLDRAAVEAVRGWRFEPAMRKGKAEASSVRVPVDFRLDDSVTASN